MSTGQHHTGSGSDIRRAVRHGIITVVFALACFAVAALSQNPLHEAMIAAAPAVMFIGAFSALWVTFRTWRAGGRWQVWQGASWFLLAASVMMLMATAPVLLD
ncbi:hypothetical protein GII30_06505 [Gordonia amarae]|uniref:Transmembrane protein n=2 Tax=Gordonia amarae TaxID=36821 RepID=G7GP68_9ACTN|nr:hypothetical protein [Gordonia amarae]MCS3878020.1 hypothetical protein [Gordonia amarae]QHN16720.1 hypothetical protein GII35_06730 [Gordonia amarae]QHN21245.1 hypothetical protein GII34_06510 [Gordonia amarae]QHN30099.1 hypothetical protein GII32_06520 [Gordonia amarae]QHN38872.1 hypothetical protein GII30_06505 [Gordonia amarae]